LTSYFNTSVALWANFKQALKKCHRALLKKIFYKKRSMIGIAFFKKIGTGLGFG
jgi:hypothetical protein